MIRDRIKKRLRGIAIRALGMEEQAAARERERPKARPEDFDPSKIPPLVDGDGDTPGPNHRELIGRTWLAAQMAGNAAGTVVDVRPPQEWIAGHLPGALLLPGAQVLDRADLLPDPTHRITIYDATNEQQATAVAAGLRERGWTLARALQGGWAEWVEFGEVQEVPERWSGRWQLADPVTLEDGSQGVIQGRRADTYQVFVEGQGLREARAEELA